MVTFPKTHGGVHCSAYGYRAVRHKNSLPSTTAVWNRTNTNILSGLSLSLSASLSSAHSLALTPSLAIQNSHNALRLDKKTIRKNYVRFGQSVYCA